MLLEVAVGILAIVVARVIYPRNQTLARRIVFAIFLFFILVNLFCFAWFIAGNVWVFGAATNGYQSTDSTNMSTYCQMDLFRAAFGIIISRYIIVTIIIIVLIRYTIIRLCKGEKAPPPANDVDKMRI
jgi:bacteriorhodopsin